MTTAIKAMERILNMSPIHSGNHPYFTNGYGLRDKDTSYQGDLKTLALEYIPLLNQTPLDEAFLKERGFVDTSIEGMYKRGNLLYILHTTDGYRIPVGNYAYMFLKTRGDLNMFLRLTFEKQDD